ncbi:MAG: peptidylprolyl isomerase [Chloroflexota bacterium]
MAQAKTGDTVKVHYTGKLDDETVFDTSADRDPLEFKIGEGQLIAGFEQSVVGMEPGESKTVRIPSDNAYGPHQKEMVMVVDRKDVPQDLDPEVNQRLQVRQQDGRTFLVTVTDVSETSLTLDGNHPLAGQDLNFDIQLNEIA